MGNSTTDLVHDRRGQAGKMGERGWFSNLSREHLKKGHVQILELCVQAVMLLSSSPASS